MSATANGVFLGQVSNGDTYGMTISNQGAIGLTPGAATGVDNYIFGIYVLQAADVGGSSESGVTLTNSAAIDMNLSGVQAWGGAAIWAADQGGTSNGTSAGATVTNSGAITATMSGQRGFAGIQAVSLGGDAGASEQGGSAGTASIANSAAVDVTWTWQDVGSINNGVYGLQALSQGGNGGSNDDGDGGTGGSGGSASVKLTEGGDVTVNVSDTPPSSSAPYCAGVLAAVIGGDGGAGAGDKHYSGGNGAAAGGPAQISVTDASVVTTGDLLPGIFALLQSGAGGAGGCQDGRDCEYSDTHGEENAGYAGHVLGAGSITVGAQTQPVTVSTTGDQSAAIQMFLLGGDGGNGGSDDALSNDQDAGNGGNGGVVYGQATVTLGGTGQNLVTVTTAGDSSPGINVASLGGNGGLGGFFHAGSGGTNIGGIAGSGGSAGDITIALTAASIATNGATSSPGIVAQSIGGTGAEGGSVTGSNSAKGGGGGNGGYGGAVTVTLDSASSITTQGADSIGILAQSVAGAGGNAGTANGEDTSTGGDGGSGGAGGNVTVKNDGAITTAGATARGILAQSLAGAGGTGGSVWSIFHSGGGTGGAGGSVGAVSVTNSGSIATSGSNAQGILLQSIGGSGGAGGQASGLFDSVGGNADTNPLAADGNSVTFTSDGGSILTTGNSATGVMGQSIGGGGGDGGGASSILVSVGGSGGAGGDGKTVTATLGTGTQIVTEGDASAAVLMQSIGGGGGNAGNASSDGLFKTVAIGGSGGSGGVGGDVTISAEGTTIVTKGSTSAGLLVQSIGGGGGVGGQALSGAVGPGLAYAISVGGGGGDGGRAYTAAATVSGGSLIATGQGSCPTSPCNTLPVNSYGVVVQSIGGGGGFGGSALAEAIALAIPVSEDVQVGVAAGSAVGGTGGGGGVGGTAQFALSDGSAIATSGQGSTAVLVQSVGGGGGVGGNASALATVIGYDYTPENATSLAVTATFATGGAGGVAGNGGEVLVVLGGTIASDGTPSQDPAGSAATTIVTYGDYANGVTAQSIGGGGGDAGFGSGNTQSFGTGTSTSIGVVQGSSGGSGGDGDEVNAYLFAGNGITTYGSGAIGIAALSVGGGGGTSQGGSLSVAQSFTAGGQDYKPSLNIEMGTTGAGGGAGGDVSVTVAAPITTHGGDATGVLAQSIGGGGGLSGSAGADASADNPIVPGLAAREGTSEVAGFLKNYFSGDDQSLPTVDATFSLTLGGSGGAGGIGGTVAVDLSAAIMTAGDWAHGIVAQSIGGGGGKGGTAAASGTGGIPEITINADVALGGSGGAGGDGGVVTVNLGEGDTAIGTAGYAAAAVVAQSIGGGGGIGADGSDSAAGLMSVGGSDGGSGGGGGDGQLVTLNYGNANGTHITTTGDAADGIVLQSVGGGGGIAGAGSSLFIPSFLMSDQTLSITAGGSSAVGGDGGGVTLEENYFNKDNTLDISTGGDFAFGILAQSIGGGGGLVTVQPSAGTVTTELGGTAGSGDGGTVQVFATNVTVITNGIAAHGIVAQSIGGGGGLVRVADASNDSPALTTSWDGVNLGLNQGSGSGGDLVYVYAGGGGNIAVSGAGAVGILAQSIGGGGGLVIDDDSMFAGSSHAAYGEVCIGTCGSGGAVTAWVDVGSTVSATGENGIGVFAQSQGYGTNGQIIVKVDGTVTGGSGAGAAGIWFDGGSSNQLTVSGTVTTVDGTDGTAVTATSGTEPGTVTITNTGTIVGSIYGQTNPDSSSALMASATSSSATVTMDNSGPYHAGAVMRGTLHNSGIVNVGIPGEVRLTNVSGDFIQTGTGQLGVTIDSLNQAASHIKIDGTASLDGVVAPTAVTLLPGSMAVLTAGDLTSSAEAVDSLVFDWDAVQSEDDAVQSEDTVTLTARPDFTPDGASLSDSQASLADHFTQAWANADSGFATHFATLSHITEAEDYAAALDEFSSKDIHAQSLALINSAGAILGASMSCPVFVDKQVLLEEGNCAWLGVSGRWSDQDATGDTQGYDVSSTSYRIGAQYEIAPDWYLGGSFAYARTSATMDGGSSGDGDTFDGSMALKHTVGPWLFAGSVALAHGSFDVNRQVNLPGYSAPLESEPNVFLAGGRLRAAYQFAFDGWYIQPYGDLDVIYTNLQGVEETGSPLYALDLDSSSDTNVALSMMVEFGGRVDLEQEMTLRPYASFGLTYLPDNTRTIDGRFANQTLDNGTFTDNLEAPEVLGRIDLGLQLYSGNGFEVKAGYTADIGESFLSQSANARLAIHF